MMRNVLSITASLMLAFVNFVPAQDAPRVINGGLLNGKAISLPKPAYPADARLRKAEGMVSIKVTIDEEGNVIEAIEQPLKSTRRVGNNGTTEEIIEKHADEALVEAALAAAWAAKFSPTRLSGEPVKVTGTITYNFVAGESKFISGGVLNGKAITLLLPEYPPAAKAVRAAGAVHVQVLIDENGEVVAASAVSGHPLLRAAAVEAAKAAKFSPTLLEGNAVKVSGVIVYNFVPPDDGSN